MSVSDAVELGSRNAVYVTLKKIAKMTERSHKKTVNVETGLGQKHQTVKVNFTVILEIMTLHVMKI